jgi:hypothetical protein
VSEMLAILAALRDALPTGEAWVKETEGKNT